MHSPGNLDSTIFDRREQLKGCVSRVARHYYSLLKCGCSSVGRAPPCQGGRREFEPRHPLQPSLGAERKSKAGASAPQRWRRRAAQSLQAIEFSLCICGAKEPNCIGLKRTKTSFRRTLT